MLQKKVVEVEVHVCDMCDKEDEGNGELAKCASCGKEVCEECATQKKLGIMYPSSLIENSEPAFYCANCDEYLLEEKDPRIMAYKECLEAMNAYRVLIAEIRAKSDILRDNIKRLSPQGPEPTPLVNSFMDILARAAQRARERKEEEAGKGETKAVV